MPTQANFHLDIHFLALWRYQRTRGVLPSRPKRLGAANDTRTNLHLMIELINNNNDLPLSSQIVCPSILCLKANADSIISHGQTERLRSKFCSCESLIWPDHTVFISDSRTRFKPDRVSLITLVKT